MLPKIPLPTGAVDVDGQTVIIRGLSRTEYLAVGRFGRDGFEDGEALILSAGTGVTVDEAKTWLNTTDPQTAGTVLDAIVALSGGIGSDGTNPKPDTSEP